MFIEICYEDDYCLIVNKPNDILIHHSHMARNLEGEETLLDILYKQTQLKLFPVHRLDRKTSGLIVLAKQNKYVKEFQNLFEQNAIQKTYMALVRGYLQNSGSITTPVKGRDAKVYKEAHTDYECLEQFELNIAVGPYDKSRYSLVSLKPKTGRMHQLRVHMNKISHPIIGDTKYGDRFHNRMFVKEFDVHKMFLHALSIKFVHPFTHQEITIKASFPNSWRFIVSKFNCRLAY